MPSIANTEEFIENSDTAGYSKRKYPAWKQKGFNVKELLGNKLNNLDAG